MVIGISGISGYPNYDSEYIQILAMLRKYGIMPTGNKLIDLSALKRAEKAEKSKAPEPLNNTNGNFDINFNTSLNSTTSTEVNKQSMSAQNNIAPQETNQIIENMVGANYLSELKKLELGLL